MRLSEATLARLAPGVSRFAYDRAAQAIGIVHFGIGAFHRAHQAWYTDLAMDGGDRDWGIMGVSLRSAGVAAQMNPQDGLYSVTERATAGSKTRVVGAVREVVVAATARQRVVDLVAAPSTRIASFTITEKGYCRRADGSLDFALAGDASVYGYLAEGLRRRRDDRLAGLTLLSCDNLADNGKQLAGLLGEYLERTDPALGRWVAEECAFPGTMIDRIVPATTDADRTEVARVLGLDDAAAVITEPFSQWVIEDRFADGRPRWETVGAQFTGDVSAYEIAKLRMLNGAHSALAYIGLAHGHQFVHQAIADPEIRPSIMRLMLEEAAPSVPDAAGLDLNPYAEQLLARFANPALPHRLIQIAMDGSQKLPQRWFQTLAFHQQRGASCPAIMAGLGAWIGHLRGANGPVDDPLAAELAFAVQGEDEGVFARLFGPQGVVATPWMPSHVDEAALRAGMARA